MICPTVLALARTWSNPVNTLSVRRLAILFTNPGCVSDSWTIIFLWSNAAAKITGKATKPPLQKTTSISYLINRKKAWRNPAPNKNMSRIFLSLEDRLVSLRYLPDKIVTNVVGTTFSRLLQIVSSKLPLDPNRYKWLICLTYVGLLSRKSSKLFIGKTCPPVPHQAIAMVIFFSWENCLVCIILSDIDKSFLGWISYPFPSRLSRAFI